MRKRANGEDVIAFAQQKSGRDMLAGAAGVGGRDRKSWVLRFLCDQKFNSCTKLHASERRIAIDTTVMEQLLCTPWNCVLDIRAKISYTNIHSNNHLGSGLWDAVLFLEPYQCLLLDDDSTHFQLQ